MGGSRWQATRRHIFPARREALDFAVTSGLRCGFYFESVNDGAAATIAYEARKRSFLDTAARCKEGILFLPMIIEASGGAWGAEARKIWSRLAHSISRLTGEPPSIKAEGIYQ